MSGTYFRIYDNTADEFLDGNYDNVEDANEALMDFADAFARREKWHDLSIRQID